MISVPSSVASLAFGPGLAAFPAFPDPATVNPFALGFAVANDSLSFSLNGYTFAWRGDFAAAAAAMTTVVDTANGPIPLFYLGLSPLSGVNLPVNLSGVQVTRDADGAFVIGFAGATSNTLSLAGFFTTLLDPRNYTDDIITAFFGSTAPFATLDLSNFSNAVVLARPNASITGPDGERGIVAYAQETDGFAFTTVLGGAGDDRIAGVGADESLVGDSGDDALLGRGGNDTLRGMSERDVLVGGAGDDDLSGGPGDDVLIGGEGSNFLGGGSGADRFVIGPGPGQDRIADLDGVEGDRVDVSALGLSLPVLRAALAGATATADGVVVNFGGGRSVVFEGLSAAPNLSLFVRMPTAATAADEVKIAGPTVSWLDGGTGDDVIAGGPLASWLFGAAGDDVALGGAAADRIYGLAGDDVLDGGAGGDFVSGGPGSDVVWGAEGDDRLFGEAGQDFLDGGDGDDALEGGAGSDAMAGGAGRDTFVFRSRDGATDRVTDFQVGLDLIDIRFLLARPLTAENLAQFVSVTSPSATHLTRFLLVDGDGAGWRARPVEIAQFDNLTTADLLNPANYILG